MNAKDTINATLHLSATVIAAYVSDLADADLLKRPGQGCNHLAWQLGHLISSEASLLNMLEPGAGPELPAGFNEKHAKANSGSDNAADFLSKAEYLALSEKLHNASRALLERFPAERLDEPAPEHLKSICPTLGAVFVLIATHPMMHAGQFVPVRRALGKPILI